MQLNTARFKIYVIVSSADSVRSNQPHQQQCGSVTCLDLPPNLPKNKSYC